MANRWSTRKSAIKNRDHAFVKRRAFARWSNSLEAAKSSEVMYTQMEPTTNRLP